MYRIKLKNHFPVAEGTMAFEFEKPAGFEFRAGQFGEWKIANPPYTDAEGNQRAFSFASAPGDERLMLATRMRDTAFKNSLKEMPLGTTVELDGPFGSMTLRNSAEKPLVFLAGGIGITPFRSMVRRAAAEKLPHKIFLFYSNRRPEDAAFLKELNDLQQRNSNFKLIATMTEAEKSAHPWEGEKGFIFEAMIRRYVDNLAFPIYYIAGPPAFAAAMWQMLKAAGVDEDNIISEEFAGY